MSGEGGIGAIWIGEETLVLASRSITRRDLLAACGISVEFVPADVDERDIEAQAASTGALPAALARRLAGEKALAVSRRLRGRLVLGADQVLDFEDQSLAKSPDLVALAVRLRRLSGHRHRLVSSAALAQDGVLLFEATETAGLEMYDLTTAQIETYLDIVGEAVLLSVGGYQVEGIGRLLFSRIEGDQAVILGLPLTSLLAHFRSAGLLAL